MMYFFAKESTKKDNIVPATSVARKFRARKKSFFWSHNKWLQIQNQSDPSFIWPWCGYVL